MISKLFCFIIFTLGIFIKAQNEFITLWKMDAPLITQMTVPYPVNDQQIWFPGIGENFTVQWEEVGYPQHNGTMTVTSTKQFLIDFGQPLNPSLADVYYKVKISNGSGIFRKMKFGEEEYDATNSTWIWRIYGTNYRLAEILQWGNIVWESMENAFVWCRPLKISATDIPNLSQVTNAAYMFGYANNLEAGTTLPNWDMSSIENFSGMFRSDNFPAALNIFNTNLSNWNVSNATNMSYMFAGRANYNQPMTNWNVSKVTNMEGMFLNCKLFDQPLNHWNVGNVTNFSFMFMDSPLFNQPLNLWNTSSATTFESMFHNDIAFNQPIGNWNTQNVTNMRSMFMTNFGTGSFNQPIDNWNTSSLKNTQQMFLNATFFDQPLNNWNVSNLEIATMMFGGAASFNQPLNLWNTINLKNSMSMFLHATSFNQNLGDWKIPKLTVATGMLSNTAMDCENYSRTLVGWANDPLTPNNINLSPVSPFTYSPQAIPSHNILTSKGWTLNGDAVGECMLLSTNEAHKDLLKIYPNPSHDYVYIQNLEHGSTVTLSSNTGQLISHPKLENEKLDIRHLPKGVYYLQIKKEGIVLKNIKLLKN